LGEPKIAIAIQGGTAGDYDTPQKVIQIIGSIWEDIDMLKDILYVLSYANDYAKKLIGKYLIIELRSLSACFDRLSQFDEDYKDNLYPIFLDKIKKLEVELKFGVLPTPRVDPVIRNKISAHRDLNIDLVTTIELWEKNTRYNILQYLDVYSDHLNKLLEKYPNEAKFYFNMRKTPMGGITDVKNPEDNNYQPFDIELEPRGD
jgi:hypothetical protein